MQDQNTIIHEINNVKIAFTDKAMTAYGGFSLLASFFEKIKLREGIQQIIPIVEVSPNATGAYAKIISYSLILFAGGERFSHVLYLGGRKILCALFGVKRLIKAGTSLTRMFNRMDTMKESDDVGEKIWEYLKNLIPWKSIQEDWLNFDSTVLERYGHQEGAKRGYNPKKKGRASHCPILAFLNQSNYVVHMWNRSGNVASWNNIHRFFTMSYDRVKEHIKVLGIVADSGFYERRFIELLEEKRLKYIIAVRLYHTVQRKVRNIDVWQQVDAGIEISEFEFTHESWEHSRRYIVIRQDITQRPEAMGKQLHLSFINPDEKSYRYSVWVTNSDADAYEVWKQCRPRANDENTIKELKEDFALGGFCLKKFYATEIAMLIRVMIYNLFVVFRTSILDSKEKTQRLKTLRYKYFVIPAQLGSCARDTILRLSMHTDTVKDKMKELYNRLTEYGVTLSKVKRNAFGEGF